MARLENCWRYAPLWAGAYRSREFMTTMAFGIHSWKRRMELSLARPRTPGHTMAKEVSNRKDMADLQGLDLHVFRKARRALNWKDRCFLQPIQDGPFWVRSLRANSMWRTQDGVEDVTVRTHMNTGALTVRNVGRFTGDISGSFSRRIPCRVL